jgi:hypothetical protein
MKMKIAALNTPIQLYQLILNTMPIKSRRLPQTPEAIAHRKQLTAEYAKRQRDYYKSLSPEAKAEIKQNRIYDKQRREDDKQESASMLAHKAMLSKAKAVLLYMKKTDVLYHHHNQSDSMMKDIIKALDRLNQTESNSIGFRIRDKEIRLPRHNEYNSYIWNYQGEGNNYLPLCQFGCIWRGPFDTIYDVPLDGSYTFSIYDSGQRGLGSFNGITATEVEKPVYVPKVSPGSIIPITAF